MGTGATLAAWIDQEQPSAGLEAVVLPAPPLIGFSLQYNTVAEAEGAQRTDVLASILGGLLGLGSELEIALILAPAGVGYWTLEPASVASNAGLVAGLGGSCRNLT